MSPNALRHSIEVTAPRTKRTLVEQSVVVRRDVPGFDLAAQILVKHRLEEEMVFVADQGNFAGSDKSSAVNRPPIHADDQNSCGLCSLMWFSNQGSRLRSFQKLLTLIIRTANASPKPERGPGFLGEPPARVVETTGVPDQCSTIVCRSVLTGATAPGTDFIGEIWQSVDDPSRRTVGKRAVNVCFVIQILAFADLYAVTAVWEGHL